MDSEKKESTGTLPYTTVDHQKNRGPESKDSPTTGQKDKGDGSNEDWSKFEKPGTGK